MVFANYMRTWFLIDLIAAVPFDRFFASEDASAIIRAPGLIKTVRLLKLRTQRARCPAAAPHRHQLASPRHHHAVAHHWEPRACAELAASLPRACPELGDHWEPRACGMPSETRVASLERRPHHAQVERFELRPRAQGEAH